MLLLLTSSVASMMTKVMDDDQDDQDNQDCMPSKLKKGEMAKRKTHSALKTMESG